MALPVYLFLFLVSTTLSGIGHFFKAIFLYRHDYKQLAFGIRIGTFWS